MPTGVGTAILIGSLVSTGVAAGTEIYKGKKTGDAAKQAADTQVAAAGKAAARLEQSQSANDALFKNAQAQYQPYVTMGQQAMSMLGATGGYTGVPTGAPALGATTASGDAGQSLLSDPANDQIRQAYKTYLGREPTLSEIMSQTGKGEFGVQDPRLALSVENIRYSPEAQARATGAAQPAPQNQSGYTKMRGPDGSMKDIPAQYVDHYTKLGAQVIG